jgi:hypothetical protein
LQQRYDYLARIRDDYNRNQLLRNAEARQMGTMPRSGFSGSADYRSHQNVLGELADLEAMDKTGAPARRVANYGDSPAISALSRNYQAGTGFRETSEAANDDAYRQQMQRMAQLGAADKLDYAGELRDREREQYRIANDPMEIRYREELERGAARRTGDFMRSEAERTGQVIRDERRRDVNSDAETYTDIPVWKKRRAEQEREDEVVRNRYQVPAELRAQGQVGAAQARSEGQVGAAEWGARGRELSSALAALARLYSSDEFTPESRVQSGVAAVAPHAATGPQPQATKPFPADQLPLLMQDKGWTEAEARQWLAQNGYAVQ